VRTRCALRRTAHPAAHCPARLLDVVSLRDPYCTVDNAVAATCPLHAALPLRYHNAPHLFARYASLPTRALPRAAAAPLHNAPLPPRPATPLQHFATHGTTAHTAHTFRAAPVHSAHRARSSPAATQPAPAGTAHATRAAHLLLAPSPAAPHHLRAAPAPRTLPCATAPLPPTCLPLPHAHPTYTACLCHTYHRTTHHTRTHAPHAFFATLLPHTRHARLLSHRATHTHAHTPHTHTLPALHAPTLLHPSPTTAHLGW